MADIVAAALSTNLVAWLLVSLGICLGFLIGLVLNGAVSALRDRQDKVQ